ncbi:hypothetical protein HaLaN_25184 [Haematococcus lacustris]|uniref:Uncharacterized protein n=1 Tax=Haematococcus lacustris TaxID=44745 RepID=A0A699ZVM0_HAELA|nr:hypothetical protein HaLaN_25184 [Haematococcus lacustris]
MKDLTAEQQQDVKLVVARLAEVAPYAATEELDEFEMGAWDPDMTHAHRNILSIEKAEELVFIQANDELSNCNQRDQAKELAIELY